jgi:hypothetical protein
MRPHAPSISRHALRKSSGSENAMKPYLACVQNQGQAHRPHG